jgi:hypothetical protein
MESFHRDRVRSIEAGDAPFRMKPGGAVVLHLVPIVSVLAPRRYTATELKEHGQRILPPGQSSCHSRFNADGMANHDGRPECRAYSQLFRDGRLEAVIGDAAYAQDRLTILRDQVCERAVIGLVGSYLKFCTEMGIEPPVRLFASITGCEGARIKIWHGDLSENAIDRHVAHLPDFEVGTLDADPAQILRPFFDCLWM